MFHVKQGLGRRLVTVFHVERLDSCDSSPTSRTRRSESGILIGDRHVQPDNLEISEASDSPSQSTRLPLGESACWAQLAKSRCVPRARAMTQSKSASDNGKSSIRPRNG